MTIVSVGPLGWILGLLSRSSEKEEKRRIPRVTDGGVPSSMEKEKIIKDDGRYLIYYRFGDESVDLGRAKRVCGCNNSGTDCSNAQGHGTHFPKAKGCGTCRS